MSEDVRLSWADTPDMVLLRLENLLPFRASDIKAALPQDGARVLLAVAGEKYIEGVLIDAVDPDRSQDLNGVLTTNGDWTGLTWSLRKRQAGKWPGAQFLASGFAFGMGGAALTDDAGANGHSNPHLETLVPRSGPDQQLESDAAPEPVQEVGAGVATESCGSLEETCICQLLEATACSPGSPLPPGTADAARQLNGRVVEALAIPDADKRLAYFQQLMSWLETLIEADKASNYRSGDAITVDEAMALSALTHLILLSIDTVGLATTSTDFPWSWIHPQWAFGNDSASFDVVRRFVKSARLKRAVQLLEDPMTSPMDRAAAGDMVCFITFQLFANTDVDEATGSAKPELVEQMLVESGLIRAFGPAFKISLPTSCSADGDPCYLFTRFLDHLQMWLSNAKTTCSMQPERYTRICHHIIDCGCATVLCQYIELFAAADPAEDAHVLQWFTLVVSDLQMIASAQGGARRVLDECCTSPKALHTALMACSERGHKCPAALKMLHVHIKAGMCIAVLFGREEDEEGANTVPAVVTAEIVRSMKYIVDGEVSKPALAPWRQSFTRSCTPVLAILPLPARFFALPIAPLFSPLIC